MGLGTTSVALSNTSNWHRKFSHANKCRTCVYEYKDLKHFTIRLPLAHFDTNVNKPKIISNQNLLDLL